MDGWNAPSDIPYLHSSTAGLQFVFSCSKFSQLSLTALHIPGPCRSSTFPFSTPGRITNTRPIQPPKLISGPQGREPTTPPPLIIPHLGCTRAKKRPSFYFSLLEFEWAQMKEASFLRSTWQGHSAGIPNMRERRHNPPPADEAALKVESLICLVWLDSRWDPAEICMIAQVLPANETLAFCQIFELARK